MIKTLFRYLFQDVDSSCRLHWKEIQKGNPKKYYGEWQNFGSISSWNWSLKSDYHFSEARKTRKL